MMEFPDKGIANEVEKVLNGFSGYYDGNYHFITAEKITPLRAIFEPIFDDSGSVSGGIVIIEDITQKRIAERAILDELEKEHARIGQVLHDSLGQKLGAVLYFVRAFEKNIKKPGNYLIKNSIIALKNIFRNNYWNLYYIILESVNNAVRHGDAEKIRLLYYSNEGENYFTVVSDQKNIYKVENPGMGLRIMKYRAEISGMEINIISDDKRVEVNISIN